VRFLLAVDNVYMSILPLNIMSLINVKSLLRVSIFSFLFVIFYVSQKLHLSQLLILSLFDYADTIYTECPTKDRESSEFIREDKEFLKKNISDKSCRI